MSDSLRPHESQHARPPCPSPTPGVHSDSRPLSRWCHPAISSSVIPFSSCPQFLPASVFSNESTLRMRWPKYWSFSFSLIPSKEIPGLISFWLAVIKKWKLKSLSCVPLFGTPWTIQSNSLGQNTGVGYHAFLWGIFLTQGSNSRLPHCRQILYQLSHKGSWSFFNSLKTWYVKAPLFEEKYRLYMFIAYNFFHWQNWNCKGCMFS